MAINNIETLASMDLPNGDKLLVEMAEVNGSYRVSLRQWYEKDGDWFPGRNGMLLNLDHFTEIGKVKVPAKYKNSTPAGSAPAATGRKL